MTYKSQEKDCLSKWIDVNVIPFYHHLRGRRHKVRQSVLSTTLANRFNTWSAFYSTELP